VKKLVLATALVIAALALLWLQVGATERPSTAPAKQDVATVPTAASQASGLAIAAQKIAAVDASKPQKLDPASDAFFYKFDEQIPPMLTAEAAKCYTGGIRRVHRNQKVKLGYTINIKDGVVSISDVKVVESTVNDKALETCFANEVAKVTWRDDELPDWQQDDHLLIRPERGMKKFTAENLAYEGDGPIGKLESAGDVAGSRELPR
jgi:hypothetical protein